MRFHGTNDDIIQSSYFSSAAAVFGMALGAPPIDTCIFVMPMQHIYVSGRIFHQNIAFS